jgi:hypothetical protein
MNFTKVSGPVLEMLGVKVDSIAGAPADPEDDGWNAEERAALQASIAERKPFLDFIFNHVNAAGVHQRFQVSGEPMFNKSSRFIGYRGIGMELKAYQDKVEDEDDGSI